MLNAAIIGYGGIARVHRNAYKKLEKLGVAKLVAVYDKFPEAFAAKGEINIGGGADLGEEVNCYTDLEEMLAKEKIDFVDICVPTYLHAEITIDMLRRGYSVMCEKPMSLKYSECEDMIRTAKEVNKELMIGQCVRFTPAYGHIKEALSDLRYGKPCGALFTRMSSPPVWGFEKWFMSPERSGGCLTDLHVHDTDLVRYLFGEPKEVRCMANTSICVNDTVHSSFFFDDFPVTAIGDWTLVGVPFKAEGQINFEKATLVFSSDVLTVYPKDGSESYVVALEDRSMYELELEYFVSVLEGKTKNLTNPPESAAKTIRLVECMRESAKNGGTIVKTDI